MNDTYAYYFIAVSDEYCIYLPHHSKALNIRISNTHT